MCPPPPDSHWTTLRAVEVERLLILSAFVADVFVDATVKFPVTVRFDATILEKLAVPEFTVKFPERFESPLTSRDPRLPTENTFNSPWTLL
jgi:hypothetical protein